MPPFNDNTDLLDGDRLYEGQLVYPNEQRLVYTGINASGGVIPFGRLVCLDETAEGDGDRIPLILPDDANALVRGIAIKTDRFEKREGFSLDANGNFGYPAGYEVSYLVLGTIGVRARQAITPDDPAFWIHTPAAGEFAGEFRIDANTNAAVQLANGTWRRAGAEDSVVPLTINLA